MWRQVKGDPLWDPLKWGASGQNASKTTTPGLDKFLVAGVGIQYETRRRNKFAGYIMDAKRTGDLDYEIKMFVDEANGYVQTDTLHASGLTDPCYSNCPKYINVRDIAPRQSNPRVEFSSWDHDGPLPQAVVDFIHEADTVHVSSFYRAKPSDALLAPSRAGSNSRGGLPGFTRVLPSDKRTVVMPDFSGTLITSS